MKPKSWRVIFIICLAAIILTASLVIVDRSFDIRFPVSAITTSNISEKKLIWNDDNNRVQKGNTCGAHAAMAFIASYKYRIYDPDIIYSEINEKFENGYIWPWGITRFLFEEGVSAKIYFLGLSGSQSRINWLKHKLQNGNPIIVVTGNDKYLHYVTLLGYDENHFMIYDSSITQNLNGDHPGNTDILFHELDTKMISARFQSFNIPIAITVLD